MDEREQIFYKQKNKQDNRIYLDLVKGVAIFLMLWGHCIQYCSLGDFDFFEDPAFRFIYSFHMPLFMLVSGYLFFFSCKKRNLPQLLVRRIQSLLQPLIICIILIHFLTTVIVKRNLSSIINGPWIDKLGTDSLWFLWGVLVSSIVVGIAAKAIVHKTVKILIIILGFGFVCMFPNWETNLYMYPYFVLGFIYAKYKDHIPKMLTNLKYLVLLAFPVMLIFYKKRHYIYTTGIISSDSIFELIRIDGFRWAIGLAGSIFMLVIIELLYNTMIVKKPSIAKPISQLGVKSLQVYCLSIALLSFWLPKLYGKFCSLLGSNIFATNRFFYSFVFTPVLAISYG